MNRAEYANAIRDLLALDIDAAALLPPDDESSGFDNIADVLTVSPSLMERYLSASWNISRLAVGNPNIAPSTSVYRVRPDLSQDQHIDGLPPGTRGGILVQHTFPLDGEYIIKLRLWRNTFDLMRGMEDPHDIEIAMDGQRLTLVTAGGREEFLKMAENPGTFGTDLDQRLTVKVPVKAGPHTHLGDDRPEEPRRRDDMIKPFLRTTIDGLDIMGDPSVDRLTIEGPYTADRLGRYRLAPQDLRLQPTGPGGRNGLRHADPLVAGAGGLPSPRRQDDRRHVDGLLSPGPRGRDRQRRLRSRHRVGAAVHPRQSGVPDPLRDRSAEPARRNAAYRLDDLALASRLSFFLWSSIPDDQLLTLASQGKLKDPVVLEQQVKRMLADARSKALIANFAEQWLHLRNLKNSVPDLEAFPDFDDNLRQAMKEETTLFFDSIVREDRSVVDLLNADYTFVNERLARHYGIPNMYGSQFRRVTVTDEARRGLLGQASILTVTSYPNRTSPVERGKWILTNLLGVPPQPPPPNVPPLQETSADGKVLSLRERMEQHRAESGLRGLPQGDGPDRLRARELRRRRTVAEHGGRRRDRHVRHALQRRRAWTASSGSAGTSWPSRRSSWAS